MTSNTTVPSEAVPSWWTMYRWRVLKYLLTLAVLCLCAVPQAWAGDMWVLWSGEVKKGDIPVYSVERETFAAVDSMMTALGIPPTGRTDALIATLSGQKIEFWADSPAVRINGSIATLPYPVSQKDGHWWVESQTALRLFNQFLASAGINSRLKWAGVVQDGDGPQTTPQPTVRPTPSVTPADKAETQELPPSIYVSTGVRLSALRWGMQADGVRAVMDVSSTAAVNVERAKDTAKVAVIVPDGFVPPQSPVPELVSVQVSKITGGNQLTFNHTAGSVKVVKLDNPPRVAIDFIGTLPATVTTPEGRDEGPTAADDKDDGVEPVKPTGGRRPIVAVDAGHGAHDPGAVANGVKEKTINLAVAQKLAESLRRYGIDARLTRNEDRFLKLAERTALANKWDADVFVSVHCNALPAGKHAKGMEIYLMALPTDKDAMKLALVENREVGASQSGSSDAGAASDRRTRLLLQILGDMQQNEKINESTSLAEDLFKVSKAAGINTRRVAQAPFFVLRGAAMPAVLVELGFITEKDEAAKLSQPSHQSKMADTIASGVVQFLKRQGITQ